jgi:hypothetical protein
MPIIRNKTVLPALLVALHFKSDDFTFTPIFEFLRLGSNDNDIVINDNDIVIFRR